MMKSDYLAHSPPYPGGPWHLLKDHLAGVGQLADGYGRDIGLGELALRSAHLHDLGKYGDLFQRRLLGLEAGIDHWTTGAAAALKHLGSPHIALAIQGHHVGLQSGAKAALLEMFGLRPCPPELRLSGSDMQDVIGRYESDGFTMGSPAAKELGSPGLADQMSLTRMLFSCLVDADFIDTEAHFGRTPGKHKALRADGPALDVEKAIAALDRHMEQFDRGDSHVDAMRIRVQADCRRASDLSTGLFTLSAPTGYGKTLAMLRFALHHANTHGLRRIVIVLPFLNLIEETAKVYRQVFAEFPDGYVLEDHSLTDDPDSQAPSQDGDSGPSIKLASQNWDAPIVITTNVRLLESLHANRPSSCRKLHRIGRAVILMDEVQTLPTSLAVVTLATLSALATRFGSTVVFATATQPAFATLDERVRQWSVGGWSPKEIVSNCIDLFLHSKRVSVDWRTNAQSWDDIAGELAERTDTMAIVNLRKDAARLTTLLADQVGTEDLYHLSTNMVVEHRRQVLELVRQSPCRLVSTQCVEAGVDLDFRRVFRAWAPLDSIAQAAGRCNRHGRSELGKVVVFTPEEEGFPDASYRQATQVARNLVSHTANAKLHDPELFQQFYRRLYQARGVGEGQGRVESDIIGALESHNFAEVARLYRLIPSEGVNIIVPVAEVRKRDGSDLLGLDHSERSRGLISQAERGLTRGLIRQLRPYTVSTFLPKNHNLPRQQLRIRIGREVQDLPGWFLLLVPEAYDPIVGLLTHTYQGEYIV